MRTMTDHILRTYYYHTYRVGPNADGLSSIERFAAAFRSLRNQDIDGPEAWDKWVGCFASNGWMDQLHFDDVLRNFGISEGTARQLMRTEIDYQEEEGTSKKVIATYCYVIAM